MERVADVVDVERVIVMQLPGCPHLGFIKINRRSASKPSTRELRPTPLWCALELNDARTAQRREDMKDQFARWTSRIDESVTDGPKADTAITQILDEAD